jgi:hypothetical protein
VDLYRDFNSEPSAANPVANRFTDRAIPVLTVFDNIKYPLLTNVLKFFTLNWWIVQTATLPTMQMHGPYG